MRFNEQGRSMIEMLGVLAIVGVLSVGGIAGYSKAMNKFKTNKLIEQVNMISTNVRTLYASQKSYEGLKNGSAIRTGILPNEMYDANNTASVNMDYTNSQAEITNAFAGNTIITTGSVKDTSANDHGAFIISMDKIPEASCVSIATTEWGGDAGGGLLAMAIVSGANAASTLLSDLTSVVNSTAATDGVFVVSDGGLPVQVSNAAAICADAENAIAWKYM